MPPASARSSFSFYIFLYDSHDFLKLLKIRIQVTGFQNDFAYNRIDSDPREQKKENPHDTETRNGYAPWPVDG